MELKKYTKKGILTVTQLAHTFRPRRKGKRSQQRTPHYHALQAMAVRDNTLYLFGTPEIPTSPVEIYLDAEGDLHATHVYLIGMIVRDGNAEKHYSFWADDQEHEATILQQFLAVVGQYDDFVVFTYGGYEKTFIKRMRKRARTKRPVDQVLARIVNVLSIIYSHIYFPCYSNGLKDIGRWLGCSWSDDQPSGLQALVWRARWRANHDDELKSKLLEYNLDDCAALKKMTDFLRALPAGLRAIPSPSTRSARGTNKPNRGIRAFSLRLGMGQSAFLPSRFRSTSTSAPTSITSGSG